MICLYITDFILLIIISCGCCSKKKQTYINNNYLSYDDTVIDIIPDTNELYN